MRSLGEWRGATKGYQQHIVRLLFHSIAAAWAAVAAVAASVAVGELGFASGGGGLSIRQDS